VAAPLSSGWLSRLMPLSRSCIMKGRMLQR